MKYFAFYLVLLSTIQADSQTIKEGTIIDYYLDLPVVGAKISVINKNIEVTTDSLGDFKVALEDTDYILVHAIGYRTVKVKATENPRFSVHIVSIHPPAEEARFYSVVDEPANLIGDQDFLEHIFNSFRYWDKVKKDGITGLVKFEMKIDNTGKVIEVKLVKGLVKFIDDEVLRIAKESRWVPARLNDSNVNTRYNMSVSF